MNNYVVCLLLNRGKEAIMVANINLIKQESYSVVNLEKQLSNTSIEKLNVLTRHIFNVNNEEDVLKLIN